MNEFRRFDDFAKANGFAMRIRNFDADCGFPRNSLDEKRFRFEREAQIIRQSGNAAVLDSGFRLEFKSCYYRPRINLRDVALYVEFFRLLLDGASAIFQLSLVHLLAAFCI